MTVATQKRVWFRRFIVAAIAYLGAIALATTVVNRVDPVPLWLGASLALVALVPALYMMLSGPRLETRREGVERSVTLRSTSLAFFVTMAA